MEGERGLLIVIEEGISLNGARLSGVEWVGMLDSLTLKVDGKRILV